MGAVLSIKEDEEGPCVEVLGCAIGLGATCLPPYVGETTSTCGRVLKSMLLGRYWTRAVIDRSEEVDGLLIACEGECSGYVRRSVQKQITIYLVSFYRCFDKEYRFPAVTGTREVGFRALSVGRRTSLRQARSGLLFGLCYNNRGEE